MQEPKKNEPKHCHENHRKRMYERADRNGFSGFADHELLEMLLFSCIPRCDTNPIAHALLNRFGSVKGVLDASVSQLCEVEGIGKKSATQIKLCVELLRRYERCIYTPAASYRKLSRISEYLAPYFVGENTERLYLLLFNNRMNLLGCELISEGVTNATDVNVSKILTLSLRMGASSVVLAHNHPMGDPHPSAEDRMLTDLLDERLRSVSVVLLEHLIFVDAFCFPMLRDMRGEYRVSPLEAKMDAGFYHRFYEGNGDLLQLPRLFLEE